jgi:uncharacterized protein YegP (UPF0339 family)
MPFEARRCRAVEPHYKGGNVKRYNFRVYKDRKNRWRWQVRDFNNKKLIGASTESYNNRRECTENIRRLGSILARDLTKNTRGEFDYIGGMEE